MPPATLVQTHAMLAATPLLPRHLCISTEATQVSRVAPESSTTHPPGSMRAVRSSGDVYEPGQGRCQRQRRMNGETRATLFAHSLSKQANGFSRRPHVKHARRKAGNRSVRVQKGLRARSVTRKPTLCAWQEAPWRRPRLRRAHLLSQTRGSVLRHVLAAELLAAATLTETTSISMH